MAKEEISSGGQNENIMEVEPAKASQNNGKSSKARAKSDTKPRKKKANSKKTLEPAVLTTISQITVAVITVIGTITVAWLSHQATLSKSTSTPIPVPTSIMTLSPVLPFTDVPVGFTETPSSTALPTYTSAVTAAALPSETVTPSPQPKLVVLLNSSTTSGKTPLTVKFDARDSYLTDYGGQTYVCRNGPCYYTWKVYSGGQQVGSSENSKSGTFDYKFGKRGTYTVTVWICRGQNRIDCGGSGIQIVVTK